MKKNKETKKLKEGEEVIFSDGKTLMEKVTVESLDKKGGFAVLSNKVKISRILSPNGTFPRFDGKPSNIMPLTEESLKMWEAFKAYFHLKNNLDLLGDKLSSLKDTGDLIIELDKKVQKIINKFIEQ